MIQTFSQFSPESKIWVYAANRTLTAQEVLVLETSLQDFTRSWTAHEMQMRAASVVLYNQIVVIALDETLHSISGCGIDKSVKLMKDTGEQLKVNFFNRMQVLCLQSESLQTFDKQCLQLAINAGEVDANTQVWNPVVANLGEFLNKGLVKLSDSWMAPQLQFLVQTK